MESITIISEKEELIVEQINSEEPIGFELIINLNNKFYHFNNYNIT